MGSKELLEPKRKVKVTSLYSNAMKIHKHHISYGFGNTPIHVYKKTPKKDSFASVKKPTEIPGDYKKNERAKSSTEVNDHLERET